MGEFLDWVSWDGKTHLRNGGAIPWGRWGPWLDKKERASWAFTSLSFVTMDAMRLGTSSLPHHDGWLYLLQLGVKINPFFFELLCSEFVTTTRKVTHIHTRGPSCESRKLPPFSEALCVSEAICTQSIRGTKINFHLFLYRQTRPGFYTWAVHNFVSCKKKLIITE